MTSPPEGRDGPASVAALAVQLNKLRREVESLTGKLDTVARAQREQAAVLVDLTELREQVEQVLSTLRSEEDAPPAEWFWLTMPEERRSEQFSELFDWVETVLRTQYPDYLADQIRPCWSNHSEARWELAWLYQLWSGIYLADGAELKDAADWHDRWGRCCVDRSCGRETCLVTSSGSHSVFAGFRFPREVIAVAVRWYLRYGLSYRDVEELLAERGVTVDHVTVYRWVQRFTPEFIEAARLCCACRESRPWL